VDDRSAAQRELAATLELMRYAGYVEIAPTNMRSVRTETMRLFDEVSEQATIGRFCISGPDDIGAAIRHFLTQEAADSEAAGSAA